jgi:uncharacterized protein (TIGR03067 family)
MRLFLLIIVLLGMMNGAGPAMDDVKIDIEKFEGTWKVVSAEEGGRKSPDEAIKHAKMIITHQKITLKFRDETRVSTYKLDSTKNPKWCDITDSDHTALGIYHLEGDQLKICLPQVGEKRRSTAFESKPNSVNHLLMIMEREKP